MKDSQKANGTFTINKTASYSLPTFKVMPETGLIEVEETINIDFVRGVKSKKAMAILELVDIGQGPIWKYEDPEGKVEHFPLIHSGLKKINAKWLENDKFQLEIYDGEKNAGIQVLYTGVLTSEDQPIGADENFLVDAYVAAIEVEQEVPAQPGTTIECLLAMLVHDLHSKHLEIPSRETSIAITKLEEAQLWLAKRKVNRRKRGVLATNEA